MINDDDDSNPIDRALNLTPMAQTSTVTSIIAAAKNDSASEDFKFSRANIREVIENGTDAISKLAVIAEQSQNPRAYEVLAKLMDTVSSASKQLLEIQVQIRGIEKADVPKDEEARKQVTNNLFVGSTAELQKMIIDIKSQSNQSI